MSLMTQKHLYHLVDFSPWPVITATGLLSLLLGTALYMHAYTNGFLIAFIGLLLLISCLIIWWRDVIREATYEGQHTEEVQHGLRYGMILFIISEIFFFLAFFWGFFHSSLSPVIEIGSVWPPEGIKGFNPWQIPFLNTIILLSSGATITWAHHVIISDYRKEVLIALELTIGLAVAFTALQLYEYIEAAFSIADGIYGATFFMATGFHGLHVIIGTLIIFIMTLRIYYNQLSQEHHFGFEAGAWYWHFVDVVWLFLFITIYWWASIE